MLDEKLRMKMAEIDQLQEELRKKGGEIKIKPATQENLWDDEVFSEKIREK